jgi:hypothetical protein
MHIVQWVHIFLSTLDALKEYQMTNIGQERSGKFVS